MGREDNIVKTKSKSFAIRIVHLFQHLKDEHKEFVLSKQVLRSGTSIGANLAESEYAVSKKDFLNKISIALKECAETIFWIDLLFEGGYITDEEYSSLKKDCEELIKLLTSISKTVKDTLVSSECN